MKSQRIAKGAGHGRTSPKSADALRAADAAWLKAYAAKDLDRAVARCDERGSMLMPNAPVATGKKEITRMIAGHFAMADTEVAWRPDKAGVARSGDLGYTSGTYRLSFKDASGKSVSDKGKYLIIWKKQTDGAWKVLFDISNSDLPQLAPRVLPSR